MYNNIGLPTPRGSGTSGYVQRNLSHVGNKTYNRLMYERDPEKAKTDALYKKIDKGILEHEKKREIEIKCLELRDMLEDQGYPSEELESKINEFRQALLERQKEEDLKNTGKKEEIEQEFNEFKNKKMREALGISADYVEGSAFNFEEKKEIAQSQKAAINLQKEIKAEKLIFINLRDKKEALAEKITRVKSDKQVKPDISKRRKRSTSSSNHERTKRRDRRRERRTSSREIERSRARSNGKRKERRRSSSDREEDSRRRNDKIIYTIRRNSSSRSRSRSRSPRRSRRHYH